MLEVLLERLPYKIRSCLDEPWLLVGDTGNTIALCDTFEVLLPSRLEYYEDFQYRAPFKSTSEAK